MSQKRKNKKGNSQQQSNGPKSRKEIRKEQRQQKKQVRSEHFRSFQKKRSLGKASDENTAGKFVLLGKTINNQASNQKKKTKKGKSKMMSVGDRMKNDMLEDKMQQRLVENEMKKRRNEQLAEENLKEDKIIKQLQKQLNMDKRKGRSMPKSFVDAGLDYILDVCDSSKIQDAVQAEINLQECEGEFEEDLAMITGKSKKGVVKKSSTKTNQDEKESHSLEGSDLESEASDFDLEGTDDGSSYDDDSDDAPDELPSNNRKSPLQKDTQSSKNISQPTLEESFDDDPSEDENDNSDSSDNDEQSEGLTPPSQKNNTNVGIKRKADNETKTNKKVKFADEFDEDESIFDENEEASGSEDGREESNGLREDIYGRLRDKEGNVIEQETTKYIPPHLREAPVDDKKKAELDKLSKNLKGQLNRLAENNMHSIAYQIDDLYMRHSRYDMNSTLLKHFMESLVSRVHTPERLVMEHAMLIAILHANVGSEVGAYFLQHIGKKFEDLHAISSQIENKELDNLLLFLCHLYTFKIYDSVLLYNVLDRLTNTFSPKDVDLILVVLRSVGFNLRKDNPIALKDFILKVQKLANAAGSMKDDPRVRFMLDILLSIKNNNMSKIPQYDTTHSEHLKKIIKAMFRKGNYVTELKITLEELLKADERGKWWVVGSAWTGPAPQATKSTTPTKVGLGTYTQDILDLAKKHRMNTVNRKNIFCILMTAEDYLDAFEKLLKLGLKGQPEQDIVHVLIHCLLSEATYNPYYAHIADQLCMSDRRHRMTIQYSVWDRFKELKSHSNHKITNLAKFLAHLFIQNSLPFSTLKVLEFTQMDKSCVRLLRQVLLSILLHNDKDTMIAVFSRVAKPMKLNMFRESIRLFMHHFLLKNITENQNTEFLKLKDCISLAEQALMAFSDSR